jgi:hypothetical protein
VVESTALEMRHTGNCIGGSNPSLSANCAELRANTQLSLEAQLRGGRRSLDGFRPAIGFGQLPDRSASWDRTFLDVIASPRRE